MDDERRQMGLKHLSNGMRYYAAALLMASLAGVLNGLVTEAVVLALVALLLVVLGSRLR